METTLGGDRLGSGNKQEISYRNYERSTHDLSYLWRSTMSAGTLVPFMCKLALPGDNFKIELNTEVMTLPTIGPLFGSYKVQLDIFEVPMRLYNAALHMNKLGIGMDMSKIFLPQIKLLANNHAAYDQTFDDNEHINPSCILKYLGISGLGRITGVTNPAIRYFNAIPLLAYWDIFKNYYSNKQEDNAFVIASDSAAVAAAMTPVGAKLITGYNEYNIFDVGTTVVTTGDEVQIFYPTNATQPKNLSAVACHIAAAAKTTGDLLDNIQWNQPNKVLSGTIKASETGKQVYIDKTDSDISRNYVQYVFELVDFPLSNIDDMREAILQAATGSAFIIDNASDMPYSAMMQVYGADEVLKYGSYFSQNGLAVKTYQSDLFNNWINTDWIDGVGGISDLTAIDTSGGEFTIDALNIAQKVYIMLNRIAVSGGTYDDWLQAVYTHERVRSVENPIYHGSLIKELAFQEVISNASATGADGNNQPLGQLAGRGRLTQKHKGGLINITVNEPSYIMGIVSLTPRIEFSQGNEFDVNLKSYDDFHKPALDAIGFQDLIVEQMLWTDTEVASATGAITQHSLGKQPAWINYMTSVNKVYGAFAQENNSMFMTLNRRYAKDTDGTILDGTTYIDPTKFNNIFADTSLESMNFWVQISASIEARRKMSAKVIPNL